MKPIGDVTVLIHDTGLFLPMARRMAEGCKRVLWYNPDRRGYPSIKQGIIGDGFDNIEVTQDFWPLLDDIDLFCFPDIHHGGLQVQLEAIGKAVWGARMADRLERGREFFLSTIHLLGLDLPKYEIVIGLLKLREHLREKENLYIKISNWRGDMETTHWRNWSMDRVWLDWMAQKLGPVQDYFRFLVFDPIETPLELGADTYCVDGEWPDTMLNGLECKDTTYIGAVTPRSKLPEQISHIQDAFSPFLKEHRYRQQWSTEVRVKDDKSYFIDATCRGGMPSSGSQQLLWENFPEIIWAGANGELVQPKPTAKFSIECMVTVKPRKHCYDAVELDEAIDRNVRFSNCAFLDGCYIFPPDEWHTGELGWLVALGDTPRAALDEAKRIADQLPDGLDANLENLTSLIGEIEEAKKQGIEFTKAPVPAAAEVVED